MIKTYVKNVHEILSDISKMERPERIKALRNIGQFQNIVNDLLACQFNEYIKERIVLPEGEPPENMVKFSDENNYPKELAKLYVNFKYFIDMPDNKLDVARRERLFIEMLEGIHPKDAKLVMKVFTKQKWPYDKTISKAVVQEALPKLFEKPVWVK